MIKNHGYHGLTRMKTNKEQPRKAQKSRKMEFTTNALKGRDMNSLRVLTLGIETPTNPRSVGAEQMIYNQNHSIVGAGLAPALQRDWLTTNNTDENER